MREEIDRINAPVTGGSNLGWRVYEGTQCTNFDPCVQPANYLPPVAEYAHTDSRCSITGGYVYRGSQLTSLQGKYIFADYCTGEILSLEGTTPTLLLDTPHFINSFGEDKNGELYITTSSGQLLKIATTATP